jgi:hypothetical protein
VGVTRPTYWGSTTTRDGTKKKKINSDKKLVANALADVVGTKGMEANEAMNSKTLRKKIKKVYPTKPIKHIVEDFPGVLRYEPDGGGTLYDVRKIATSEGHKPSLSFYCCSFLLLRCAAHAPLCFYAYPRGAAAAQHERCRGADEPHRRLRVQHERQHAESALRTRHCSCSCRSRRTHNNNNSNSSSRFARRAGRGGYKSQFQFQFQCRPPRDVLLRG